ncbi:MAG TPA: hypothetical protein PK147_03540 [Saprospiraceae bacterium]|nr:hypothetical protein [Saprospiraceae bacterium]MCB9329051.1 hypothetical protein [Lewinellaceae bacterium]HPK09334.1 hypothetical protein [Saprospiraceae bacterium]HPQ20895.1 hypothetical protein [Saprospiraceae bacterium]HRX28702.1 hypothetical protein [Saprospiraceae bacterium]
MKKTKELNHFLKFFPEIELPANFTEETAQIFSAENEALPQSLIEFFVTKWEGELDEFTEIIPCAKIAESDEYAAIVYYKISLLKHEFILATIGTDAHLIDKKTIAAFMAEDQVLRQSVARIDEDLIIYIMAGHAVSEFQFDPSQNQSFSMEIMPSGNIEFYNNKYEVE